SEAKLIEDAVGAHGPFRDIATLHRVSGVKAASLRKLAQADAFQSMGLDRQRALWEVRPLRDEELPLLEKVARCRGVEVSSVESLSGSPSTPRYPDTPTPSEEVSRCQGAKMSRENQTASPSTPRNLDTSTPSLPPIPAPTRVIHDYAATGLSL